MRKNSKYVIASLLMIAVFVPLTLLWNTLHRPTPSVQQSTQTDNSNGDLKKQFADILDNYRKIIVLLDQDQTLPATEREQGNQVGQSLFHDNLAKIETASNALNSLITSNKAERLSILSALLDYVETDTSLFDADRLAFRELLQTMQGAIAKDSTIPAIKLHKRISEDLDALNEIERMYEKEISQIFGRFEQRAIELKRERWDDYLQHLKKLYSREKILKEHGIITPYPAEKTERRKDIGGHELPAKTLLLTFDDGPHPVYSAEIEAILKQYNIPAVFFNVGNNLGSIKEGKAQISSRGEVSRKLMQDGFLLGNHSYTHAQLSKVSGESLRNEILNTDTLLKAINSKRSPLFRFPYGASNKEADQILDGAQLQSMMWNIDSLDWADPIPSSIANRVLQTVQKEGRGIVLFHDIHERTVKALPSILDKLITEGYQFANWDSGSFKATSTSNNETQPISASYGNSWAVVIGIDSYSKWPQLRYAANDAKSIQQLLINRYGFNKAQVITLLDGEATRQNILSALNEKLSKGGIKKDDRIMVFFAGHGATRKLSSGRDLGYIIPVDSDPTHIESDAIPMTEIQNIAENLTAKHVLFVMDACYSGLGLTRGAGSNAYLRDNAKRLGRQMLTAGGAEQMVADNGPNGHSIFTWTLIQGLEGKGDLNGDGFITATELAAYVAPAVAGVSQQTPAFGSLPGSQGGEFIFEVRAGNEFLTADTSQLDNEAISLNNKLASATPKSEVILKDLQGETRKIALPTVAPSSYKQRAQRANDKGLQLYKEKRYSEAEIEFTEALKLKPDYALAANNLGFVYFKQNKFKEAAAWFENTLKIDPSRAIAYINLGDTYMQLNNHEKAKQAFKTYLELAPTGNAAGHAKEQMGKI